MQRASDAVAILAILVGTGASLALSSRIKANRTSPSAVEVLLPNAPTNLDGVLRVPLPPLEERGVIVTRPDRALQLRVMHVPTVYRGVEEVRHQRHERQERHKRKKRQKRRRPSGR